MNLGSKEEYISRFKDCKITRIEDAAKDWEHLSKATKGKDTSGIPKGDYCYTWIEGTKNRYGMPDQKYCPYMSVKEYGGVPVPYCKYMEWGSIDNAITEEEYAKLVKYFGSEEKMDEELPLFLLWDSCKECGENHYTPEEAEIYGNSSKKES